MDEDYGAESVRPKYVESEPKTKRKPGWGSEPKLERKPLIKSVPFGGERSKYEMRYL